MKTKSNLFILAFGAALAALPAKAQLPTPTGSIFDALVADPVTLVEGGRADASLRATLRSFVRGNGSASFSALAGSTEAQTRANARALAQVGWERASGDAVRAAGCARGQRAAKLTADAEPLATAFQHEVDQAADPAPAWFQMNAFSSGSFGAGGLYGYETPPQSSFAQALACIDSSNRVAKITLRPSAGVSGTIEFQRDSLGRLTEIAVSRGEIRRVETRRFDEAILKEISRVDYQNRGGQRRKFRECSGAPPLAIFPLPGIREHDLAIIMARGKVNLDLPRSTYREAERASENARALEAANRSYDDLRLRDEAVDAEIGRLDRVIAEARLAQDAPRAQEALKQNAYLIEESGRISLAIGQASARLYRLEKERRAVVEGASASGWRPIELPSEAEALRCEPGERAFRLDAPSLLGTVTRAPSRPLDRQESLVDAARSVLQLRSALRRAAEDPLGRQGPTLRTSRSNANNPEEALEFRLNSRATAEATAKEILGETRVREIERISDENQERRASLELSFRLGSSPMRACVGANGLIRKVQRDLPGAVDSEILTFDRDPRGALTKVVSDFGGLRMVQTVGAGDGDHSATTIEQFVLPPGGAPRLANRCTFYPTVAPLPAPPTISPAVVDLPDAPPPRNRAPAY